MGNDDQAELPGVVDSFYPVNETLSAKYKQAFGYVTIRYRLPIILSGIIQSVKDGESDMVAQHGEAAREQTHKVVHKLETLKDELVENHRLSKTSSPTWNSYLEHVGKEFFNGDPTQETWITGPFLHVECYMYHRMQEAFISSEIFKNFDPFRKQKEDGFHQSLGAIEALLDWCKVTDFQKPENMQSLLETCLWGNRCDLSISQGADNSQKTNLVDQLTELRAKVLCDDSAKFWNHLKCGSKQPVSESKSLGVILDNAGFELLTDLCLATEVIKAGVVDKVVFYAKEQPWFVSDVLEKDFRWLVQALCRAEGRPVLNEAGQLWTEYLNNKVFTVVEHHFWTYPHTFNEMRTADPDLYSRLSGHKFLIFKGDLNYRKLIGEINWAYDTPFEKALQGFHPAPLLSLRTLKADAVAGLAPGVAEALSQVNHKWMNTGEYGVIQFSSVIQS